MADVTITTEEPSEGSGDVGVAAGMAVAVAGQAAQDAEAAVEQAETATEVSLAAQDNAAVAAEAAYDARADVASLREEFGMFASELRQALAERQPPAEVVEVAEPAPEPAPAGNGDGDTSQDTKPKADKNKPTRSYGSKAWFG